MDKITKDYLPYVYAKYPFIAQQDIDNIINFGLKIFILAIMKNLWVTLCSKTFFISTADYWTMSNNVLKYVNEYKNALAKKIRFLNNLRKFPYDGYYYFYMNKDSYKKFLEENKLSIAYNKKKNTINKKPLIYRNIRMFKYKEECWAKSYPCKHIFRYPITDSSIYENKAYLTEEQLITCKVQEVFRGRKPRKWNSIRYNVHDYAIKYYRINKLDKWRLKNK